MAKKKIAVFISGSGTNLQALIDHSKNVSKSQSSGSKKVQSKAGRKLEGERLSRDRLGPKSAVSR